MISNEYEREEKRRHVAFASEGFSLEFWFGLVLKYGLLYPVFGKR